jgi:hypothetical protein
MFEEWLQILTQTHRWKGFAEPQRQLWPRPESPVGFAYTPKRDSSMLMFGQLVGAGKMTAMESEMSTDGNRCLRAARHPRQRLHLLRHRHRRHLQTATHSKNLWQLFKPEAAAMAFDGYNGSLSTKITRSARMVLTGFSAQTQATRQVRLQISSATVDCLSIGASGQKPATH